MTMAIFPIIVHFSTQRVRSMHDVACEFACAIKAGFHYRRSRSRNRRRRLKRTYDQVKIENRSHKLDGSGVGRIGTFPFLTIPFMTPSLMIK